MNVPAQGKKYKKQSVNSENELRLLFIFACIDYRQRCKRFCTMNCTGVFNHLSSFSYFSCAYAFCPL